MTSIQDRPRDEGAVILRYQADDFAAEVRAVEGYELWWTDYVANDWSETYPTLPAAVVRLGVLIAAASQDRLFRQRLPAEFGRALMGLEEILDRFIEGELESPPEAPSSP